MTQATEASLTPGNGRCCSIDQKHGWVQRVESRQVTSTSRQPHVDVGALTSTYADVEYPRNYLYEAFHRYTTNHKRTHTHTHTHTHHTAKQHVLGRRGHECWVQLSDSETPTVPGKILMNGSISRPLHSRCFLCDAGKS